MSDIEAMFGVRDADDSLGQRLREVVASRDIEALNRLITVEHPNVLWGKYTRQLSEEDRRWAMQSLERR